MKGGWLLHLPGSCPEAALKHTANTKADAQHRVCTHFSRSNSSTFQALLRVILKFFQHLIAGVKYISTGIYTLVYFFSLFITIMYIVLCCKHLKWCFMIAKTLEIKGEHKVLSKKKGSHLASFRNTRTETERDLRAPQFPFLTYIFRFQNAVFGVTCYKSNAIPVMHYFFL